MRVKVGVVVLTLLASAMGWSSAAVPESERVAVTDPAELEALGLPPSATGIFRRVVGGEGAPPEEQQPDDYGILTINHTAVMGRAFVPEDVSFKPDAVGGAALACEDGAGGWGVAQLQLPDGVEFFGVRAWAYDSDQPGDVYLQVYEDCQADFAGSPITSTQLLSYYVTSGTGGNQSAYKEVSGGPITIDNSSCVYRMKVILGAPCHGNSLMLQKVRAEWRRQLSPAPATATFADVQTGHPFFQYIEALADSGITAGCGGGNYCPDAPVTRGQMAVFLAKALGLHWTISNH